MVCDADVTSIQGEPNRHVPIQATRHYYPHFEPHANLYRYDVSARSWFSSVYRGRSGNPNETQGKVNQLSAMGS